MTRAAAYLGRDAAPPGLKRLATGKVRDIFELDAERLLFVTTDRVSAFDVVMDEGIPHKGRVLTAISAHWFERTADIIPGHLLSVDVNEVPGLSDAWRERLDGRIMIVRRCEPTPVEWVVRGFVVGSGWKEYQARGTISALPQPPGMLQAQRLPAPILTPSTKDEIHDRPISPTEAAEMVGSEAFATLERVSLALFERGTQELAELDIILADTKFEFGLSGDELILIDEVLTPDSSRFWPRAEYRTGISPPSFDKQILRDHLETLDWNKEAPPPNLDPVVLERVGARYLEVCEMICGSLPRGVVA
ncbi:MAG TPA: phosphoribosylaminoimidazolesuccinocarboxamide synthase [Planctomycetes bacterium]|nr:phosphoribosylaminoimidazolesuccinocarboxamide synthase [Planctomycetota bacterium]HIL51136.1 phosphoribosylaminoimidazolesuccinocarboxamide synthase [Planctomycetota bacterium]